MASQNLPGFAVLRASGYQPPTQPVLAITGAVSLGTAFLGAHTSNLAAISAALCTGPEAHPDPAQRWKAGVFYALWWGLIALFGASLVGLFGALPPALLATVAGTALLGSMAGAMGTAFAADKERFAAAGTLAVTASGITLMGVGSAFWCWPGSACCAANANVGRGRYAAWAGSLRPTGEAIVRHFFVAVFAAFAVALGGAVQAQTPAAPPAAQAAVREITRIAGEVYRLRNNGHYSVFAVTPAGIIATDPINAEAATWLKEEMKKRWPDKAIKFVVYSHDHADHISGGEVWADT